MLFGLEDGPEKATQFVAEVQPLATLPPTSWAVIVSRNEVPTARVVDAVLLVGGAAPAVSPLSDTWAPAARPLATSPKEPLPLERYRLNDVAPVGSEDGAVTVLVHWPKPPPKQLPRVLAFETATLGPGRVAPAEFTAVTS